MIIVFGFYSEKFTNWRHFCFKSTDGAPVKIGKKVFLAPNVQIYTATHPLDIQRRCIDNIEFSKPITIGDYVWIGGNATICPGVTIGNVSGYYTWKIFLFSFENLINKLKLFFFSFWRVRLSELVQSLLKMFQKMLLLQEILQK